MTGQGHSQGGAGLSDHDPSAAASNQGGGGPHTLTSSLLTRVFRGKKRVCLPLGSPLLAAGRRVGARLIPWALLEPAPPGPLGTIGFESRAPRTDMWADEFKGGLLTGGSDPGPLHSPLPGTLAICHTRLPPWAVGSARHTHPECSGWTPHPGKGAGREVGPSQGPSARSFCSLPGVLSAMWETRFHPWRGPEPQGSAPCPQPPHQR